MLNYRETYWSLPPSFTIILLILTFLTGCSSDSVYSPLENQVYRHASELAKRVPKNFIRKEINDGILYHDPVLDMKDVNDISDSSKLVGSGTVIFVSKEAEILYAGYADFDELNGKTHPEKKTKIFMRIDFGVASERLFIAVDAVALINGKTAIIYNNEEGWKKGTTIIESFKDGIDMEEVCQTPVPDKEVDRYLRLTQRIKEKYLEE